MISITAPDGSRTQIDYHDTLNLPVAVSDPAGRITEYAYDGRGNLIHITDPAGHSTGYTYNEQWLPATITTQPATTSAATTPTAAAKVSNTTASTV
ncbi:RHS repeat domain-containing protein [Neisseria canis]|uniref:RHS repeat domain-containing protein n=1 Tax=Neisseria canis TaxID=493 RepID=UPI000A246943|nr:RHS repeat domain-containing protein [Neisseria canis]OSI09591.1 hypothetical protein BWD07_11470 [Neisseria canis]